MSRWCLSTVRNTGGWRTQLPLNSHLTRSINHFPFSLDDIAQRTPPKPISNTFLNRPLRSDSSVTISLYRRKAPAPQGNSLDRPDGHATSSSSLVAAEITPDEEDYQKQQALSILKSFLSSANDMEHALPVVGVPTTNTIRSLYFSIKKYNVLRRLTPTEMSSLIQLYGSLSMSTRDKAYHSIHSHPFTGTLLSRQPIRTYWPFVVKLGLDKDRIYGLCSSDHFWLMHAHLALAQMPAADSDASGHHARITQAYSSATRHYRHVRGSYGRPDVHLPYLRRILADKSRFSQEDVTETISFLIDTYTLSHPLMLQCLWVFLLNAPDLSFPLRRHLLKTLASRVAQIAKPSQSNGSSPMSDAKRMGPHRPMSHDRLEDTKALDIGDLANVLTNVFSCVEYKGPRTIQRWSSRTVQSTLAAESPSALESSWTRLVLLASINEDSSSIDRIRLAHPEPGHSMDWEAICILASIESSLRTDHRRPFCPTMDPAKENALRVILNQIWNLWSTSATGGGEDTRVVRVIILTSFVYVAGCVHDSAILRACEDFGKTLWHSEHPQGGHRNLMGQYLAELISANLACGHDVHPSVTKSIRAAPDPELRTFMMNQVMYRLSSQQPQLAYAIYVLAQHASVDISTSAVFRLACNAVRATVASVALELIKGSTLSPTQRAAVVSNILRLFVAAPRHSRFAGTLDVLCQVIKDLVTHPRRTRYMSDDFSVQIYKAVMCMLNLGFDKPAALVLKALAGIDGTASLFTSARLQRLIPRLMHRRQFRLATRFIVMATKRPDLGPMWARLLSLQLSQRGAHRLARQCWPSKQAHRSTRDKLIHAVRFRYYSPSRATTAKIRALLSRCTLDEPSIRLGLHLLLSGGDLRGAKLFFDRVGSQVTPATRAVLGNELMHATLTYRSRPNRCRVRSALRLLKDLTENTEFVPDRVTVNILVKGLLHWKNGLDANAVRALFDRLILTGYPGGDGSDSGPFKTASTFHHLDLSLPQVTSPILFHRHIRPLYKMFIKALHSRADVYGARKVLGIFKEAEREEILRTTPYKL